MTAIGTTAQIFIPAESPSRTPASTTARRVCRPDQGRSSSRHSSTSRVPIVSIVVRASQKVAGYHSA